MDISQLWELLSEVFFVGRVSSVDASTCSAIVIMPDADNKTTAPLTVGQRGSKSTKDFWLPAVDDQVLCMRLPNKSGKGFDSGLVICTLYSEVDMPPSGASDNTRVLDTPGNLTIKVGGSLNLTYGSGDVIVNGISLVNHTHGGVLPGGGTTGKPI